MAVLCYSADHYAGWRQELSIAEMGPGGFAENFTISGQDELSVCIGDVYRVGAATVQISQPRGPCYKISYRWKRPDLVLIDGGPGQLSIACQVFADLGVEDVALVGISKGPDRDAGREHFYMPGKEPFRLDHKSPVLYYLQRLRDEAHRFVIGGHRKKRSAAIGANPLDEIAGVGASRKRALLQHFGSARAVTAASLTDLAAVGGVSATLAKKVYDFFHPT